MKHGLRATLTPDPDRLRSRPRPAPRRRDHHREDLLDEGARCAALDGIKQSDLPVVLGVTLIAALFIVVANLIVDLLYGVVDPRVRHS